MEIVSKKEQTRMREAYRLRKLTENDYHRDFTNENTRFILDYFFKLQSLLSTELTKTNAANGVLNATQTAVLLSAPFGAFYSIADKFASYVGTPKFGDNSVSIAQAIADYIATGYATLVFSKTENGRHRIECVAASATTTEDGNVRTVHLYEAEKATYAHVRTYLPGINRNELFRLPDSISLQDVQPVDLTTIPITANMPAEELTGFTLPAAYIVHDGLPPYGQSVFAVAEPIVRSIERKMVMFDSQFIQNVESFVLFKNIVLPPESRTNGGKVSLAKLGRVFMGNEEATIEFVNNTNPLISDALGFTTRQMYQLSALTSIPEEFLGIESRDGSIGEGSRNLKHGAFVKKVEAIRSRFEEAFAEMVRVLATASIKMDGRITWDDIFAKTDGELVDELTKARDSKLISQKRAISIYLGGDENAAEAELAAIRAENTITNP